MSLLQGILTKRSPANFREVIQAQNPALKTDQGFLIPGANINPKLNVTNIGAYKARPSDFVPSLTANYDNRIPEVKFLVDGQNLVQPQSNLATYALISKLGDQKFKAMDNAPYADYMRIKKLEREILESENTAGLSELQTSRELMRSLAEERRKQAEDDYLRKMLDSGLSMEDAQDEIETVRRNNALQEAKKVDDRQYQSKILLTRIAKSRGIASNINEPLSQSGAVMSPQPSDLIATLQGNKGEGFGNAPLDVARQFLTPDYYKKFLRKTQLTQESADKMTAMNQLISAGESSFATPLQFEGQKRQQNLENIKEGIAQQMDSLKMIGQRHLMRLPGIIFAEKSMAKIYDKIDKGIGAKVRSKTSNLDSLTTAQLLVLINIFLTNEPSKIAVMKGYLQKRLVGKTVNVEKDLLKEAIQNFNGDQQFVTVPVFEGLGSLISQEELNADAIQFLTTSSDVLNGKAKKAQIIVEKLTAEESGNKLPNKEQMSQRKLPIMLSQLVEKKKQEELKQLMIPLGVERLQNVVSGKTGALSKVMKSLRERENEKIKTEVGATMEDMLKKLESQPSNASASASSAVKKPLEEMTVAEIKAELEKRNLAKTGDKKKLSKRLQDAGY
jgi:hypothetical protein